MAITKVLKNPPRTQHAVVCSISYVFNADKTLGEKALYIDTIGCSTLTAATDFERTRKSWDKNWGNLAYHFVQSFSPNEVTPEEAHQCGVELAQMLWGKNGYQVAIGTHLNKDHLHNHFIVNAVNSDTGKKLRADLSFIKTMQSYNDRICSKHNLSVISDPKGKDKSYAEWITEKNNGFSWRSLIRHDIDEVVKTVPTVKALFVELEKQGYTVNLNRKYISVSPPGTDTNFRLYKLGADYTVESLTKRIVLGKQRHSTIDNHHYAKPQNKKIFYYKSHFPIHKKRGGVRGLYYVYLYRLRKIFGDEKNYKTKPPTSARQDIKRMNDFSKDLQMLTKYKINDMADLAKVFIALKKEKKLHLNECQELRRELSQCDDSDVSKELVKQIENLKKSANYVQKEMTSCKRIYERTKLISARNKELAQWEVKKGQQEKQNTKSKNTIIERNDLYASRGRSN